MDEIFISLEKEVFSGNVLDIGCENYGIVYNLYKHYNNDIAIDYVEDSDEDDILKKEEYDNCIMFFSLNKFWLNHKKEEFIKEISGLLKTDGYIYIWDIDKGYSKTFNGKLKVSLPDKKIKYINIKDYNVFKDNSLNNTEKILDKYFKIVDVKKSNNIYYIKGVKRKEEINESNASSY